ncbi:MAG: hypothetical protein KDA37_16975 [Planctomycetales bacterium]|nr:hypothetical protein [Planctomycetales bacterium]
MGPWRAVKLLLTLKCDESAHLLSDSTLRPLTKVEWWAVRLHQVSCRFCRSLEKQLRQVDEAATSRVGAAASLSDAARGRIAACLREEAERQD